jgi:hypothetical protein
MEETYKKVLVLCRKKSGSLNIFYTFKIIVLNN